MFLIYTSLFINRGIHTRNIDSLILLKIRRLLVQLHGNFTPASISSSPTYSLRRFERSNHNGRGVSLSLLMGYHQRSEEHTSELQSRGHLVCRLLLEKKKEKNRQDRQ